MSNSSTFIEKMENLLVVKENVFKVILISLSIISLAIYISVTFWFRRILDAKYYDLLKIHMNIATGILVVAGILWVIYLCKKEDIKETCETLDLDGFLEEWGDRKFTRKDFAKYIYGENYTTNQYKNLGHCLRNAIGEKIRELNEGKNPRKYVRIQNQQN